MPFLAAAVLLGPSRAFAHLVTTGMGPVYDGIGHLLMTPEDLVPVFALSLYAGLRGAAMGRQTMFLLPVAWLAGGLIGLRMPGIPEFPVSAFSFLLLGALVAADLRLPGPGVAALALLLGLAHGVQNGAALREGPGGPGLLGILAALFVLAALVSSFVVSRERPWARIAVRVAGSWVAASGLLLLGWSLRG